MDITVWDLIAQSKEGLEYVPSHKQFENLQRLLATYDAKTVHTLHEEWNAKVRTMKKDPEYEKLHAENGGFVSSGDDGFYMDFGNWLLAQGELLYNEFLERGHMAVVEYVQHYHIPMEEYLYECMVYAFHDYLEDFRRFKTKEIL